MSLTSSQFGFLLFAVGLVACGTASNAQEPKNAVAAADVAARVNRILNQYLAVEEDFFKFTPGRVLPIPGVYEDMDFVGYSKKLRSLNGDLERAQADIGRQQPTRAEVRDFNSALLDYIKRLRASISALDGISMKLASMAKDPETYSWQEYSTDLDHYETLKKDYSAAGVKLNELFRRIQR
jgi:hypothetical protein